MREFGFVYLVRATGLEPARISPQEPKSCACANFATPAYVYFNWILASFFSVEWGEISL